MRAQVGDHIVLTATRVDDPTRHGEVLEVGDPDGGPPWTVRWSDGHVGVFYPGPGSVRSIEAPDSAGACGIRPGPRRRGRPVRRPHRATCGSGRSGSRSSSPVMTRARRSCSSPMPRPTSRRTAMSRRSTHDPAVPEIGDEVAVARALRHLADRLLDTAEEDIEAMTGEPAQVRRV